MPILSATAPPVGCSEQYTVPMPSLAHSAKQVTEKNDVSANKNVVDTIDIRIFLSQLGLFFKVLTAFCQNSKDDRRMSTRRGFVRSIKRLADQLCHPIECDLLTRRKPRHSFYGS